MRKVFLLSLLLLSISMHLLAQDLGKSRFGVKAGLNYSAQSVELNRERELSDFRTGFTIGFFKEIPLAPSIMLQPELSYNRLISRYEEKTTKLNYLSIPLLLKIHGKHFAGYFGPQFSLLLSGKSDELYGDEEDLKNSYSSADFGGVVGFEYSFGPANRFVVSTRYQFPLSNVLKDAASGQSVRNTGFQLTGGVRFK
ncbi:MAG: PorT family protein [Chitinophagaceae bacterium]|nr:PorT family protein [Chitinophagaceae bacterium]